MVRINQMVRGRSLRTSTRIAALPGAATLSTMVCGVAYAATQPPQPQPLAQVRIAATESTNPDPSGETTVSASPTTSAEPTVTITQSTIPDLPTPTTQPSDGGAGGGGPESTKGNKASNASPTKKPVRAATTSNDESLRLGDGEDTRVACHYANATIFFVRYKSTDERDKAYTKYLAQNIDAKQLAPGVGEPTTKKTTSGTVNGRYVEFAYKTSNDANGKPVCGMWWSDANAPIAAYLLAYWSEGLGENWEPLRTSGAATAEDGARVRDRTIAAGTALNRVPSPALTHPSAEHLARRHIGWGTPSRPGGSTVTSGLGGCHDVTIIDSMSGVLIGFPNRP